MIGSAPDGDELIGRELGEFRLVELVDRGGQGVVYRAEQRGLQREVAVKIVRHDGAASTVQRFLRETQLAARLDHPYAAHTYASGAEPDGVLWVAMELVRGRSLGDLIESEGPIALDRFVPLFERIAEVVHTAHEQGIVHRDLKPDNVLLVTRAGRLLPKLVDFGIARMIADPAVDEQGVDSPAASPLTRLGAIVGSPAYMAPEQWYDPSSVGPAADVYALTALSYKALTRRLPFEQTSVRKLAQAHSTLAVPQLGDPLPRELDAVIARGMAKRRGDRFATALELAAAMRAAAGVGLRSDALPMLDEALRDAYIADAPQPIAEAAAALDAARDLDAVWNAAWALHDTTVHWLAVVALAARARIGAGVGDRDPDPARELLAAARERELEPADCLALARAIVTPFAARADVFPVPELVDALGALAGDPFAELATLRAPGLDPGEDHAPRRDKLARVIGLLGAALRAVRFVLAYPIVVTRLGLVERWSGTRRAPRSRLDVSGTVADGEATMLTADDTPALVLAPLVRVAPPSPGAPDELFLFSGRGRRRITLRAPPTGFELPDEPLLAWYARTLAPTLVAAEATDRDDGRPPFKALAAFATEDALVFFGRERETAAILNQLLVRTLVVIVGPSGTGKSSLVQAGIVSGLPPRWRAITVRPGGTPTTALRARLAREGISVGAMPQPAELAGALRRAAPLVLVIDQLEELFTLCRDPEERACYAALLVGAATDPGEPVRVILTLRDDFLVRAEHLAAFREHLAPGLTVLATPGRTDLVRILEEPARNAGYAFDDGLVAQMVDAVADQAGALPLLSFTAARLWDLRDRHLRRLTRRAHDALGGVGGALAKHAEDTLAAMPPQQAELVREAFRHLVTGDATRAVITRGELVELLARRAQDGDATTAEGVIERLIGARLLVASEGEQLAGEREVERVEVIHETLLVAWPRLAAWQRQDADTVRLRDQLRAAARQWDSRGRRRGMLWRGDALLELRLWCTRYQGAITSVEEAFHAASIADEARGRRLRRGAAAAAFLVLALGTGLLWWMNGRAEHSAELAHRELVAGYLEQGRKELVTGSASIAGLYLAEALRGGADRPVVRLLLGRALDSIELAVAAARAHDKPVRWLAQAGRGALVSVDDGGGVRGFSSVPASSSVRAAWILELAAPVRAVAASRDGATAAIAGDGAMWLVSTADGRVQRVDRDAGAVRALAFASDGAVFSARDDGMLAEVVPATAAAGRAVRASDRPLRSLLAAVDWVATGAETGEVVLWDRATLAPRWRTRVGTKLIRALAVTPDGAMLLAGDADGVVTIIDVATGRADGALRGHNGAIIAVAVSRDGRLVGTASIDGSSRVFDLATRHQVHVWTHRAAVAAIEFTADGDHAITISVDSVARRWDLHTGRAAATYEGHTSGVFATLELADGTVVTGGADGTVRWWRAADRLHRRGWPLGDGVVQAIDWSRDGTRVAAADDHGRIAVWDVAANRQIWQLAASQGIWSTRFSPDGRQIATASEDGSVIVRDAQDGRALRTAALGAPVVTTTYGDDGTLYASTLDARVVRIAGDDNRSLPIHHSAAVWGLDVRAGRIATGSDDHVVDVTDLASGRLLFRREDEREVNAVALSPDARIVAFGGHAGRVQLAEVDSGRMLASLEGRADSVDAIEFSPDASYLITATVDGAITVWDRTGKALIVLDGPPTPFARISPLGDAVASGGADGRVRVWSIAPDLRDPSAVDALLACWVPYSLVDQRIVLRRASCVR